MRAVRRARAQTRVVPSLWCKFAVMVHGFLPVSPLSTPEFRC